jgi:hypothetical protein
MVVTSSTIALVTSRRWPASRLGVHTRAKHHVADVEGTCQCHRSATWTRVWGDGDGHRCNKKRVVDALWIKHWICMTSFTIILEILSAISWVESTYCYPAHVDLAHLQRSKLVELTFGKLVRCIYIMWISFGIFHLELVTLSWLCLCDFLMNNSWCVKCTNLQKPHFDFFIPIR